MSSQIDQLVDDVKTYIEIIRNHIDARHTRTTQITKEGFEPFLSKFEELANEVSILEAERVRLNKQNAILIEELEQQKKLVQSNIDKIAVLSEECSHWEKCSEKLNELNITQSKMLMKQNFLGFSKYHEYIEDSTDYALKA